jgi:antitoxin ChpS
MMDSRLQKWGNSMALRIPAPLLRSWGIAEGQAVALTVENGALVARPAAARYTLQQLLDQCDLKEPVDAGDAVWLESGPVGMEEL